MAAQEPLFRFALVRPPLSIEDTGDGPSHTISLVQDTPLQQRLSSATTTAETLDAARTFADSALFLKRPSETPLATQLIKFAKDLDGLGKSTNGKVDLADISHAVSDAFGQDPEALARAESFQTSLTRLRDTIIVIKTATEFQRMDIISFIRQLQDLELIRDTVEYPNQFPLSDDDISVLRNRVLHLPRKLEWQSAIADLEAQKGQSLKLGLQIDENVQKMRGLLEQYNAIGSTLKEITRLPSEHFQSTLVDKGVFKGFEVPEALDKQKLVLGQLQFQKNLADLSLKQFEGLVERPEPSTTHEPSLRLADSNNLNHSQLPTASSLPAFLLKTGPQFIEAIQAESLPGMKAQGQADSGFRLRSSALQALSDSSLNVLKATTLANIEDHTIPTIIGTLRAKTQSIAKDLDVLEAQTGEIAVSNIAPSVALRAGFVFAQPTVASDTKSWRTTGRIRDDYMVSPIAKFDWSLVPKTYGNISSSGKMDLLLVKQQLVRYEGGDVASIENIMKGEENKRDFTTKRTTEALVFTETENTTQEERDNESTTRFEMSKEVNNVLKEDSELSGNLSLSGSYGPTVQFSANAAASTKTSKEEATTAASSYAKNVTERSVKNVTDRVLQRSSLKTTNEVTEHTNHTVKNSQGDPQNISAVFQWVNKRYQCSLWQYSQREMYEFMIPEPAAFFFASILENAKTSPVGKLTPPPDISDLPAANSINESNFVSISQQYGIELQVPPAVCVTKSYAVALTNETKSGAATISVPSGYRAISATLSAVGLTTTSFVRGAIGNNLYNISGQPNAEGWYDANFTTLLEHPSPWDDNKEVDRSYPSSELAFVWTATSGSGVVITVQLDCFCATETYEKWQASVWKALLDRQKVLAQEYEDKLAGLTLQQDIAGLVSGNNPLKNQRIIKDELKKSCLAVLTAQNFDIFGSYRDVAVQGTTVKYPQFDFITSQAQGSYVRFFEEAFEWDNMSWVFYPYYWSRKSQWINKMNQDDVDPALGEFMRAGFCRVQLPAREKFATAIQHFLEGGEIWNGGELPNISSDLYLPIAIERADQLGRKGGEKPVKLDTWPLVVPTTLLKLRKDDRLPRWIPDPKSTDDEWIEEFPDSALAVEPQPNV